MDLVRHLEAVRSHDLEAVQAPAKCLSAGVTRPFVWLDTNFSVFFSSLLSVEGVKHTGAGSPQGSPRGGEGHSGTLENSISQLQFPSLTFLQGWMGSCSLRTQMKKSVRNFITFPQAEDMSNCLCHVCFLYQNIRYLFYWNHKH